MTSCATCSVVQSPYVFALQLRPASPDPQPRESKVVEPDGLTAYPPQECYPFLPVAFADREVLLLHPRHSWVGPGFPQSFSKYSLLALTPHRYWTVWPDSHPMLQAPGRHYFFC